MKHILFLALLLFNCHAHANKNFGSNAASSPTMSPEEVAKFGFQVGNTWYSRIELPKRPAGVSPDAENYMIRLIGEMSEDISPTHESPESLKKRVHNLKVYFPSQCAQLVTIGLVNNVKTCMIYIREGAELNKHAAEVALTNFNWEWGKYNSIIFKYIKK